MENKQKLIDELAYPPTHTYILDGLKPTGVLAKRLAVINGLAPNFFTKQGRFLDVGCNKGFFSLYGAQFFDEVVGIDSRTEFIELCTELKNPNTEFILTDFRNFTPIERFDRILMGNVHHYVYKNCSGTWDWLYKLAAISKGLVIIEGPVDMACPDMSKPITEDIREHFNYEEFIDIMNKFFVLKIKVPTVGYTPGRYFMVFERKPSWLENITELSDLPVIRTIKENQYTKVFETGDDLICKTFIQFEEDAIPRVNMARMSPLSNDIVGAVHHEGRWVGWLERKLRGRFFRANENEIELFKAHCRHQIFLARNGYFDFDVSTINFLLEKESQRFVCFDKNQVRPISKLIPSTYNLTDGWYFKYLGRGFKKMSARADILLPISNALATKDPVQIESVFKKVFCILNGETLNRYGVDMLNANNIKDAHAAFLCSVAQNPEFAMAHNNLGILSCYQGRYRDAIRCFEKAFFLEPSNPVIIENIRKVSEMLKSVR